METPHFFVMLILVVIGYVIGRMWAKPAQMVGLP